MDSHHLWKRVEGLNLRNTWARAQYFLRPRDIAGFPRLTVCAPRPPSPDRHTRVLLMERPHPHHPVCLRLCRHRPIPTCSRNHLLKDVCDPTAPSTAPSSSGSPGRSQGTWHLVSAQDPWPPCTHHCHRGLAEPGSGPCEGLCSGLFPVRWGGCAHPKKRLQSWGLWVSTLRGRLSPSTGAED